MVRGHLIECLFFPLAYLPGQSADAKQWENDFGSLLSKFGKLQEENFMLNAQVLIRKTNFFSFSLTS